jgi:pimeloyl-ACP methyl ester carboxylesterase
MTQSPIALAQLALGRAQALEVQLASGKTCYWTYPAKSKASKTIIMVHGYRGNHHGLEAIAGALEDFNVVIPDLPGFGRSEQLHGSHTVDSYSLWLTEFVAALNIDGAIVLGHSFGSIVTAAAAAGGLRNDLILVNPVSRFENRADQRFLNVLVNSYYGLGKSLPKPLANGLLRNGMFVRIMSEVLAKTKEPKLRNWIHAQHEQNFSDFSDRRVAVEGYHASISKSVVSFAHQIPNRTLLIAGELDDITSVDDQQRAVKLFTSGSLETIPAVGHLIHYEAPQEAAELITSFIRGNQ